MDPAQVVPSEPEDTSTDAAGDEARVDTEPAAPVLEEEDAAQGAEDPDGTDDATSVEGEPSDAAAEAPKATAKKKGAHKKGAKKKTHKRPPPKAPEAPLPPELKEEAREAALTRLAQVAKGKPDIVRRTIDLLEKGTSIPFLARFRRELTGGLDEARLRAVRDDWHEVLHLEERRVAMRALLAKRGALNDEVAATLAKARSIPAIEDLAAPYLPVTASRATMARGLHLQGLADAIRKATEATPLAELAQPFVREGEEPSSLDAALGGARDILAEELSLDPALRAELRELGRREAMLAVTARSEKRAEGEASRPSSPLVGFSARVAKVPPLKVLAIRQAEKRRQVVATIEAPEEKALVILHRHVAPEEHPHQGFLRAAAEDGYRRILKPLFQHELRDEMKQRADAVAMQQFERNLRNALLGPYAGGVRTLGLRPDVMQGHRWCAIDEEGKPAGSGTLPHEPTAGREACLTELTDILKTYEVAAIAVGTTGGRADALSLALEGAKDIESKIVVTEVQDGGTRTLEALGPLEFENHLVVGPECRGALSLARRFQDPLVELVHIDPKALALGPHMHDVHQGSLRTMLDTVIESCVAHVGVDPNRVDADLLVRVPGFQRKSAAAFLAWREQAGPLTDKAHLAAIEGVGPDVAEQAVGFLRIAAAADPRDRAQLHPEQYVVVEKMADQVGADIPTLFEDPNARKRINLDALTDAETGMPTLKYVLFQVTAGLRDPRPRFTEPIPPPPEITLQTVHPGLMLQGRVLRSAPFGLFLDVGLGIEALIPIPHVGDRPGVEPSTVAPVGAVINARVLEVDLAKKRLTLSMRRPEPGRPPRRPAGPPRSGDRGPRARRDDRPARAGAGARGSERSDAPRQFSAARETQGPARSSIGGRPGQGGRPQGGRPQGGRPQGGRPAGRGGDRKQGGRFGGGSGSGGFGGGERGGRDRFDRDRGPRTISLKPDEPDRGAEQVDTSKMSPDELMQWKLDQLKRKLERPGAD